jgi:hypothetical protein
MVGRKSKSPSTSQMLEGRMMDIMTSKRIAKLDSLTNCPCCGAPRGLALGGRKNRKVAFSCDAIFAVEPGQPIRCLLPCPGPSNTAADLLDREIIEADHRALARANALGGADKKAHARPPALRKRLSKTDIVVGAKLMTRDGRTATITDVHPECDHSRKPIEGTFPDGSLGNWMMTGSVWVNGQVDGGDLVGVAPPSPQMNCAFLCPVNLNSCRKFEVQPISVLGQLDRQFASGGRRNLHLDLMRRLVITIIDFVLALRTNVSYSQDNVLRDRRDAPFDQSTGLNFPVIIKVPFASIGIGHCGAPVTRKSCSDNTPRLPNPLSTIRGRLRENPAPAPISWGHLACDIVAKITEIAAAVGMQANVPALDIAGQIVSVLGANPEHINCFMVEGTELFLDGTFNYENGSLTYRAISGAILSPSVLRQKRGTQQ